MEQLRISLDVVYVMYAISKDWIQELGARKGINQSHCALGDVTDLILCLTVKVEQAVEAHFVRVSSLILSLNA